MVTDRSSPSRVRYAAKNAPLTAPGRSAHPPARKEREILGMAKQKQIKIYLTWTGLLMEGHYAQNSRLQGVNERNRDLSTVVLERSFWVGSHVELVLVFVGDPKSALLIKIASGIYLYNRQRHGL